MLTAPDVAAPTGARRRAFIWLAAALVLTLAGTVPLAQRGEYDNAHVKTRARVSNAHVRRHRWTVRITIDRHHSTHGLGRGLVADMRSPRVDNEVSRRVYFPRRALLWRARVQ